MGEGFSLIIFFLTVLHLKRLAFKLGCRVPDFFLGTKNMIRYSLT